MGITFDGVSVCRRNHATTQGVIELLVAQQFAQRAARLAAS
jgi:hypothetical protein